MKTLRSLSLLSLMVFFAASCQQDPQSTNGPSLPLAQGGNGGGGSTANPVITYNLPVSSHGSSYMTVGVMNADGTNQTTIYTPSSTNTGYGHPNWSPTGGSIVWSEGTSTGGYVIKAIDVSVNSNGVPVGSNLRTLVTYSGSDSVYLGGSAGSPTWCQKSSTGKIAFTPWHTNRVGPEHNILDLCTIPTSGGTVTTLTSLSNGASYGHCMWSPDDSHIAMSYSGSIVLFDASTGAVTATISESLSPYRDIAWSHSGLNSMVFARNDATAYLTPTEGSTPTTTTVNSGSVTWAPDNSSVMSSYGNLTLIDPFTNTSTTILRSFSGTEINWRQAQ